MSGLPAANAAALRLGERLNDLAVVIEQLRVAEADTTELRLEADISEAKLFLAGEGSIEAKKNKARVDNRATEFAALAAEANVRHLLRKYKEAQMRVDVGRTYSADLRAEASVAGRDM